MGGALRSLLATVVAPLWGGAWGHGPSSLAVSPVGAMGATGTLGRVQGTTPLGVGPEAPWPPLGGKYTLERRRWGGVVHISPPVPPRLGPPQDGPTRCSGTIRGSRRNSLGRTRFFYSQSNILGIDCL